MLPSEIASCFGRIPAQAAICYRDLTGSQAWGQDHRQDFPAASVIKVAIMVELLQRVEAGQSRLTERLEVASDRLVGGAGVLFELDPGLRLSLGDLCRLMIVVSDNTASNLLIDYLGGLEVMTAAMAEMGLSARLGRYFMEPPIGQRDNRMTCEDAVVLLWRLRRGELLGPELTTFARGVLERQQYREKIPQRLPAELVVGHKTGELDGVRHDAAIVEHSRPYVLAIFTRNGGHAWEVDEHIALTSRAVYDWVEQDV
ncbi:MAG: serine hydrolase [Vulcanimicrobiota bacterium]